MNICVVCSGNICRSPFVEYLLKRELLGRHVVCSAGTLGITGEPAYEECVALAPHYALDLTCHRSRGLTRDLVDKTHLWICMAQEHANMLKELGIPDRKIKLLGEYLPAGQIFDLGMFGMIQQGHDIPDPIGCPAALVDPILKVLEIATIALAENLA